MTFLQAIILKCLQKINGERTIYSVYHLLKGKKSSQTIQDAHLYQLTHFFKTMPHLKRDEYEKLIEELIQQSFIYSLEERSKYKLNENGQEILHEYFSHRSPLQYLNGWKHQDTSILLWKRLTLLVQVVSHLNHKDNHYYPIQKDPDVHLWIKQFLHTYGRGREELSTELYKELHTLFSESFPEHPLLIVLRLSGYKLIGQTYNQCAELLKMEHSEYHFRFMNGIHYMIETMIHHQAIFPIMNMLVKDVHKKAPYTKSTMKTYELLQNDLTMEEVALKRGLKISTIEDHIIEIALMDQQFSLDRFIDQQTAMNILQAAKKLGKRKLKPIKEKVEDASYFQIRLVLARSGEKI